MCIDVPRLFILSVAKLFSSRYMRADLDTEWSAWDNGAQLALNWPIVSLDKAWITFIVHQGIVRDCHATPK